MKKIGLLLFALLTAACTVDKIAEHLVVDGWIEDGKYPVVILTSSVAVVEGEMDYDDLQRHVLKWATVSVSDGENTYMLMGKQDDHYFPPYIYTSYSLKGQAGKTYTLNVRYGETEASAVTTIPAPQTLTHIAPNVNEDGSTIKVGFTPQDDSYYFFFTKRAQKDSTYLPCMYTLVDGSTVNGEYEGIVFPGFDIMGSEYDWHFQSGDHVSVRFCTLDREAHAYWKAINDQWIFSRSPFFPVHSGAPSNVSGGYGYWAGYGSTYYEVDIP